VADGARGPPPKQQDLDRVPGQSVGRPHRAGRVQRGV